jgi:molybdopterin converting factor small subunit
VIYNKLGLKMESTYTASFYGPFRMITKQKDIQYAIDKEEPTLQDLLTVIIEQFPDLYDYIYDKSGNPENGTAIIINGEDIRETERMQTKIQPTDRIAFFKAAGGG